jgi:predicted DsbA family dithiol-disulfide isomerase
VRIERLTERYDLGVTWVHFPLHPETPPEGRSLEDLFAGRNFDLAAMKARLVALAEQQGLAYGDRSMTYNSRLAQELGKWADGQDGGAAIHDALFRAYFVDGVNIGRPDVLLEIAGQLGLDVDEARRVLETRSFSGAVDRDWRRSREMGVAGVPTFVAGGYGVVGAQSYEALEELVVKAGAQQRRA